MFGAGILSSTGEIPYSLFSPDVTRRPFVTDVVIDTDYDPSRMQDHLFIAPSLPFLRRELEGLVRRFGIRVVSRDGAAILSIRGCSRGYRDEDLP